eukprot:TRINITY_DN11595_c1_g1_i1.p1 TRINITY_DN11595_c1_g1~~TRINITY_DN11595_c1_g1_i1.p1  ORF type:complete len:149 (-),score=4.39 TRINITY_DN11595_c1_g1_i1:86-532(-)
MIMKHYQKKRVLLEYFQTNQMLQGKNIQKNYSQIIVIFELPLILQFKLCSKQWPDFGCEGIKVQRAHQPTSQCQGKKKPSNIINVFLTGRVSLFNIRLKITIKYIIDWFFCINKMHQENAIKLQQHVQVSKFASDSQAPNSNFPIERR